MKVEKPQQCNGHGTGVDVGRLAAVINQETALIGDLNVIVNRVSTPTTADSSSVIWISSKVKNVSEIVKLTKARVIICRKQAIKASDFPSKCFIFCRDPRLAIARVVNAFFAKSRGRA